MFQESWSREAKLEASSSWITPHIPSSSFSSSCSLLRNNWQHNNNPLFSRFLLDFEAPRSLPARPRTDVSLSVCQSKTGSPLSKPFSKWPTNLRTIPILCYTCTNILGFHFQFWGLLGMRRSRRMADGANKRRSLRQDKILGWNWRKSCKFGKKSKWNASSLSLFASLQKTNPENGDTTFPDLHVAPHSRFFCSS